MVVRKRNIRKYEQRSENTKIKQVEKFTFLGIVMGNATQTSEGVLE